MGTLELVDDSYGAYTVYTDPATGEIVFEHCLDGNEPGFRVVIAMTPQVALAMGHALMRQARDGTIIDVRQNVIPIGRPR